MQDDKNSHVSSDDEDDDKSNKDPTDHKNSNSPNDKQISEKRVLRRQQAQQGYQPVFSPTSPNQNKELKKLQVYGAGPKMPGVLPDQQSPNKESTNNKVGSVDSNLTVDSCNWDCRLPQVCLQCGESNPTPMLLTCDNCENTYHTHCLIPPLNDWPKGIFFCNFIIVALD